MYISAHKYLESIRPTGISDEVWKESEAYKSVMRFTTEEACEDLISRRGVAVWLENMGYAKLAKAIMDTKRFPTEN